jgi:hypothetical protein
MPFSKILIAVDQPPSAFKMYQTGLALAEALGATVNLLHVVDPALEMGSPDLGISPPQALDSQVWFRCSKHQLQFRFLC